MKYNIKVEDRFKKEELRNWVGSLTSHDLEHIKRLMQDMYDLGHVDGYAEAILNNDDEPGD